MGGCNVKCTTNTIGNDNILIRIEKLRDELHNIVNVAGGSDKNNKVIIKSQELDKLLNDYYKDNNRHKTNYK